MSCIQVEITNKCNHKCNSCTRFVGHHKNTYFMPVKQVEDAFDSLEGFKGTTGIMGGEPTLHPDFLRILAMLRERFPIEKRQLWTSGYKWDEYYDVIHDTFLPENISYNNHKDDVEIRHHPLLIGINEVVDDRELMFQYISNCWIQNRWSASINSKGAYICEVAAAMSYWLDWDFPINVEPGWWKIQPEDDLFTEQILTYCVNCSGCMPVPFTMLDKGSVDLCSPKNYERLKKTSRKDIAIADVDEIKAYLDGKTAEPGGERGALVDFPNHTPWNYRQKPMHGPK